MKEQDMVKVTYQKKLHFIENDIFIAGKGLEHLG